MFALVKKYFLRCLIAINVTCVTFIFSIMHTPVVAQEIKAAEPSNVKTLYPVHDEYILPAIPDRIEWLNRKTFGFNNFFERFLLRPIARTYLFLTPQFFRTAIKNVTSTFKRPLSAVNAALQGDINNFFDNVFAFTHNITLGVFGLVDVYGDIADHKVHQEDFEQTMAIYGIGYGSYWVLPFLGPSSLRGAIGIWVDSQISPVAREISSNDYLALTLLEIINSYAENLELLITLQKTSIDPYAALRSFYYQNQMKKRYNDHVPEIIVPDNVQDAEDDWLDDL